MPDEEESNGEVADDGGLSAAPVSESEEREEEDGSVSWSLERRFRRDARRTSRTDESASMVANAIVYKIKRRRFDTAKRPSSMAKCGLIEPSTRDVTVDCDSECMLAAGGDAWATRRLPVDKGMPSEGAVDNAGWFGVVWCGAGLGDGRVFWRVVVEEGLVIGWRDEFVSMSMLVASVGESSVIFEGGGEGRSCKEL